ncbi:MAG: hypothetical protein QW416_07340 [Candidatus Nitrosocaldaceae archaeon]
MQYHQASIIGQKRSREAQHKLFAYSGFAYLTKTVKKKGNEFEPVGDEEFVAIDIINDEAIIVICDADGYAKAQTKALKISEAEVIINKMIADGFKKYDGDVELVR